MMISFRYLNLRVRQLCIVHWILLSGHLPISFHELLLRIKFWECSIFLLGNLSLSLFNYNSLFGYLHELLNMLIWGWFWECLVLVLILFGWVQFIGGQVVGFTHNWHDVFRFTWFFGRALSRNDFVFVWDGIGWEWSIWLLLGVPIGLLLCSGTFFGLEIPRTLRWKFVAHLLLRLYLIR